MINKWILFTLIISSCSKTSNDTKHSVDVNFSNAVYFQMMDVYPVDYTEHFVYVYVLNTQNIDTLKLFCQQIKVDKCGKGNYVIRAVFFDNAEIARLPETSSLDYVSEEALKHIKAYFYMDQLCTGSIEVYSPNRLYGTRKEIHLE